LSLSTVAKRIVIIGNSGSGKTWLAQRLAPRLQAEVVHLDDIFWMDGGFDVRRTPQEVAARIDQSKAGSCWVVEGVFGQLAARYLNVADALVWLDLPWPQCEARLLARGSESKAHMERNQSELGLQKLLLWAGAYATRGGDCSHSGHRKLFESFTGLRRHVENEAQANELAKTGFKSVPGSIVC
jgi:adenylate kinase family enzyme